jgi:hypothetical protein
MPTLLLLVPASATQHHFEYGLNGIKLFTGMRATSCFGFELVRAGSLRHAITFLPAMTPQHMQRA